ncbi:MAG TPA: cytochrome c biogenesis protein ResB [Lacunisphaera sp.]|jgi:hypothetical protein|nr:cytochrome c biogenesis protein ResB [Lacunisphaera sp.]
MKSFFLPLKNFFVSLQLTVALLILSLVLVFVATLDQVNLGIWAVQAKYFHSFFVMWHLPDTSVSLPVFPGGYVIGGLLLINLTAAHIYRFALTWRKLGIQLAHAGLILLLLGELFTGIWAKETFMRIDQGDTKHYSEAFRANELVLIDHSDPKFDEVVAIPEAVVADQKSIQHPKLPFSVTVKEYFPNSSLQMRGPGAAPSPATAGIGAQLAALPLPVTYKPDENNLPAAFVEVSSPEGSLGTWLVSPGLGMPQTFQYGGKTWEIAMRAQRQYYPFSLTLEKFSHDRYMGTDIPKNFSSRIRVRSDDGHVDREALIYMNSPLRFAGLTFYQSGFDKNDTATVLQVVHNPSWQIPYIACVMMGAGLVIQFGFSLGTFFRKRKALAAAAASMPTS